MNNNSINIVPQAQTTVKTISSFSIDVINIKLFQSAILNVILYDENKNYISSQSVEINGDDYKKWGNDDSYISNFIAQKLGLQLLPSTGS